MPDVWLDFSGDRSIPRRAGQILIDKQAFRDQEVRDARCSKQTANTKGVDVGKFAGAGHKQVALEQMELSRLRAALRA